MANESVTVDFNANVDGYTQSLQQALASTQQFAAAADFGAGKLAKLNNASFVLIKQLNSITGANKTATAQAAAYQQKISSLEATTVTAGKKMEGLAKTSMAFARQFPVGMDKSIEVVKTLQTSGVSTTKQIDQLGKSFIKLQAATGEWGSGMISDMVQITRTYGNGTQTIAGFADSLNTVTKKYGASASAVLSFTKTIAPIASVVGVSQSSVIGLSTAFASMGEDGYRSANALNKILLDMNKSVRTGSPEMREYAKAMNMTSESLSEMFKNDPTETFIRFTEIIKSQGKDAIRTLDNLGIEGVTNFKALSAASNSDLRGMVTTANQAYGSGSTEKAAEKALGGVNDEMAKLDEIMSQTVAAAGTPFLNMLEKILSAANGVASGIQKIIASPFGTFLTAAAAAAGLLFTALKGIATINFARLALAPMIAGFRGGARDLASGVTRTGSEMASSYRAIPGPVSSESAAMMTRRAQMMYNLGQSPLGQGFNNGGGGLRGVAGGIGNMAMFGGTAAMNMQTNFLRYSTDQQTVRTEAGRALSSNLSAAKIDPATGGAASFGQQIKGMGSAFAEFGKTIAGSKAAVVANSSQFGALAVAAKGLTGAFARSAAELTFTMAKVAGSMVAQMVIAMAPMIAITAVIMGAMKLYELNKKDNERKEKIGENFQNANTNYNEFAEKAGLATRGLVALAEAAKETTAQLNQQNKTKEDALNVTDKERGNAQSGSYVTAMGISKDATPQETANQIRMLVGKNADPAALAQAMGDVVAQKGADYQKQVQALYGQAEADPYATGLKNISANYGFGQRRTDESVKKSGDLQGEMVRNVDEITKVYGSQVAQVANLAEAKKLFDAAKKSGRSDDQRAAEDILQAQFGASGSMLSTSENFGEYLKSLEGNSDKTKDARSQYESITSKNINLDKVDYNALSPQTTLAKQTSLEMAQRIAGAKGLVVNTPQGPDLKARDAALGLANALNAAEDAARKNSTTVNEMSDSVKGGLDPLEKAMVNLGQNADSIIAQSEAGAELAKSAMQYNTSASTAIADLRAQQSTLAVSDTKRNAIDFAIQTINSGQTSVRAGQTMMQRTSSAIEAGRIATARGYQAIAKDEEQRLADMQAEQNAYAERVGFAKQFLEAQHSLNIQLKRQTEDYNRSVLITNRNFNLQVKYQQEDFNTSRKRQGEDFAKSFYSPYQRVAAVRVVSGSGLLANLKQQSTMLKKQMGNVKKLREMGLSQEAIDTLDLMNPANAQQADRLVADLSRDHALLLQINSETATRGKLSQAYVKSPFNQTSRRQEEEFDKQMARAVAGHKTALADMATNLGIARSRAYEDLMNFGYEASVPADKVAETMSAAFATIPESAKSNMSLALQGLIDAGQAFDGTSFTVHIGTKASSGGSGSENSGGGSGLGTGGTGRGSGGRNYPSNAGSGGENAGQIPNTANYSKNTKGFTSASDKGGQMINGVAARNNFTSTSGLGGAKLVGNTYQVMDKNGKYQNVVANDGKTLRSKFLDAVFDQIGQPYVEGGGRKKTDTEGFDCSGLVDYAATRAGMKGFSNQTAAQLYNQTKRIPDENQALPGDLVFYENNPKKPGMDHVGVYVGFGKMINAPRPNSNINVSPIRFNGSGTPVFGRFNDKNFAEGGIVTQPTNALIGEAGYPEAVVPLNNRGANILADAMGMYLDNYDAMSSRMQPYSSSTSNYTTTQYDQSTQINGQITVQAQDPNEFMRKIQAKQRRQRLIQPIGN